MIKLTLDPTPYDITLLQGLVLTVTPVDTVGMAIAQAAARRRLEDLEEALTTTAQHGLDVTDMPDLQDSDARAGLLTSYLVEELAEAHIIGWQNVQDEHGQPAALTITNKRALMKLFPIGELFLAQITTHQIQRLTAKED